MTHQNAARTGRFRRVVATAVAIIAAAGIATGIIVDNKLSDHHPGPLPVNLPAASASYLGVFTKGVPSSYAPVSAFTSATGARPDLVMYYSGWYMPFPTSFANTVASNGAVPLVQMDPDGISLAAIAAGKYDGYLSQYAVTVHAYRHPVILSFGHEMNGSWSSWGYTKTSPPVFVAAWKHIVTLFRNFRANNVTWLWTVNIINDTQKGTIPRPNPWWPGSSYVNWVGIDGYYLKPTWQFAPLFGPTINVVHQLTDDPILIAETGAVPSSDQPAKIANLFAGIHAYGLLGLVYFDAVDKQKHEQFGLSSPAAVAAFRKGASTFTRPGS